MTTYKSLLVLRSFNEQLQKNVEGAESIVPLVQLKKLVKKFNSAYEQMEESIEDLRLDHCYKEGNKIVRDDKGNYQWTAEGEKAFRKAYKELNNQEIALPQDFKPMNYYELGMALPADFLKNNPWEVMSEVLTPFFTYTTDF
jgi:predicted transcriptional regulator